MSVPQDAQEASASAEELRNTRAAEIEARRSAQSSPSTSPGPEPQSQPQQGLTMQAPALREAMVKNAVGFLTDARVASSPDEKKRSFLLSRGVTNAEINEAFRRAAETAPSPQPAAPLPPRPAGSLAGATIPQYSAPYPPPPSGPLVATLPWMSFILVSLFATGLGTTLASLIKKYLVPLFWKPKAKKKKEKRMEQIQSQVKSLATHVESTQRDVEDAMSLLKQFIKQQASVEIQRSLLESVKDGKEKAQVNALREDIESVRALMPSLGVPKRPEESPFIGAYPDLKAGVSGIKSTVEASAFKPATPSLSSSSSVQVDEETKKKAQNATMPWTRKDAKPRESQPAWLNEAPSLDWIYGDKDKKQETAEAEIAKGFPEEKPVAESRPMTAATTESPHSTEFTEIMKTVARGESPPNVKQIDDSPLEPFRNDEIEKENGENNSEGKVETEMETGKPPIVEVPSEDA